MSGRLAARALIATVLLVLTLMLALLGSDLLRWRGHAERGAVALYTGAADPAIFEPGTVLPAAVSEWLLGAGDDVRYRRVLQKYVVVRNRGYIRTGKTLPVAEADLALERFEDSDAPRRLRSLARTVRAVLLVSAASASGGSDPGLLQRLEDEFRRAIRLDRENLAAKYDLERMLRTEITQAQASLEQPPERAGSEGTRGNRGSAGTAFGGGGY